MTHLDSLSEGDRPQQDKMSGGDLDGDMCKPAFDISFLACMGCNYLNSHKTDNIITQAQADLLPRRTVDAAAYPEAP